jgi:hypothetical protein
MQRLAHLLTTILLGVGLICGAHAQSSFTTPGGAQVDGKVNMQLNGAGAAVPVAPSGPGIVSGNTNVPSYSAAVTSFGNSSAGDVYCINGSATKTVKVKGIRVSVIASAGVVNVISLIKRSTADSGGTPSAVTVVPNDSANPAATATVTAYATAPTAGTTVGTVRSQDISVATTSGSIPSLYALFQFSVYWDQPMVLHGVVEGICVNVPSTAGGSWSIDSEHTED